MSISQVVPTGVHPVAELFPMMGDDELDDLAADIAANGLIHPIVLDSAGLLIDGRNRLAACERAGIEPTFTSLNGHDPVAFILGANVTRRHLTKGQAAMAIARARLFSGNRSTTEAAREVGVSQSRVAYASVILDYAPDLADAVLSGATPLNDAYSEARKRKDQASSTAARMTRLRSAVPDLADLVTEERMTLAEAEAAARTRQAEDERQRRAATQTVAQVLTLLDPVGGVAPEVYAGELHARLAPDLLPGPPDLSSERLQRCWTTLTTLIELCERG